MPAEARPLEVLQVQASMRAAFGGSITGIGVDDQARERNFLTKALAAHFLMCEAGATLPEAVAASIDGGGDHGIDSVYISATGVLWLVQSKYIHDGDGEPPLGEVAKFRNGVVDLVSGQFARFNAALQAKMPAIQALMNGDFAVRFALVYTGTTLNDDRVDMLNDAENAINRIQPDRARFVRFGLYHLHDSITARRAEAEITAEVELTHFGLIERPVRAYYGVMSVRDLAALYQEHEHALVRANIRRYRGSSRVNAEIARTLHERPADFVYFNNGITLLCERVTAIGAMALDRARQRFRLEGVSIINGAQTAGTVAQQPLTHYDAMPAQVLVTCIESRGAGEDFGDRVTEYRNSQNAVQMGDFIALDDRQENLRRTLKTSGVTYIYKPSASDPHAGERVFSASEAARALACMWNERATWTNALLMANSDSQKLWDQRTDFQGAATADVANSVYGRLFSDSLGARRLWRLTQICRLIRGAVEADAATQGAVDAAFASASIWLLQHLMLVRLRSLIDAATLMLTTAERASISVELDAARRALRVAFDRHTWPNPDAAAVFADAANLQTLKGEVLRTLA